VIQAMVDYSSNMARSLAVVLALAIVAMASAYSDRGIVNLDDLTFDKVVDGSRAVFVRFDKEYAWGDEHDAFKEAAKRVGESAADVLVVTVPLSKVDNHLDKLTERFGVKESDWPMFKLFKKGQTSRDTPVDYKGDKKKADAMVAWVATETGAFFGLKGQIKEFDTLARKLAKGAAASALKTTAADARKLLASVSESDKPHAEYYIKVFEKLAEKADYVAAESKRLKKMVEDKGVTKDKKDGFQAKLNALASFSALA